MFFLFLFESIKAGGERRDIMAKFLNYCSVPIKVKDCAEAWIQKVSAADINITLELLKLSFRFLSVFRGKICKSGIKIP